MKMAPKRKHTTLSIKQNFDIIERLAGGESGQMLANEYGVGTSTISDIKNQPDSHQTDKIVLSKKSFSSHFV